MNRLIHIGFGNIVNTDKIIAIVSPEAAPIKRLVQKAKETGQAIDATQGRKTKMPDVRKNSENIPRIYRYVLKMRCNFVKIKTDFLSK